MGRGCTAGCGRGSPWRGSVGDSNEFESEELSGGEVWAGPTPTLGPHAILPGQLDGRMVRLDQVPIVWARASTNY